MSDDSSIPPPPAPNTAAPGDDDLYAVLGVSRDASETDIRSAYMKMALKWHPDKRAPGADREEAEKMFKRVAQAYEILSNTTSRFDYDHHGLNSVLYGARRRPASAATTASSAHVGFFQFYFTDPFDLFRSMFVAVVRRLREEGVLAAAERRLRKMVVSVALIICSCVVVEVAAISFKWEG